MIRFKFRFIDLCERCVVLVTVNSRTAEKVNDLMYTAKVHEQQGIVQEEEASSAIVFQIVPTYCIYLSMRGLPEDPLTPIVCKDIIWD